MTTHTRWQSVKRKSLLGTVAAGLAMKFSGKDIDRAMVSKSKPLTPLDVAPVAMDTTLRFLAGKLRVRAEAVMKEFNNNPRAAGLIEAAHELESYLEGGE